jgi:hypothetical protein
MEQYGTIRIHLDELIRKAGISKNKLSHRAEMQHTQINHYCNNEITRLDIDFWRGFARCGIARSVIFWNLFRRRRLRLRNKLFSMIVTASSSQGNGYDT